MAPVMADNDNKDILRNCIIKGGIKMSEETKKTEQFASEEQQDMELDLDDLEQVSGGYAVTNNEKSSNVAKNKKSISLPVIRMK